MDEPIGGDELLAVNGKGIFRKRRDQSSCLLQDDESGRHVPGVEFYFPKPIESAGRDIAQIQGGGTGATDTLRVEREPGEMVEVVVRVVPNIVGESGDQQGLI